MSVVGSTYHFGSIARLHGLGRHTNCWFAKRLLHKIFMKIQRRYKEKTIKNTKKILWKYKENIMKMILKHNSDCWQFKPHKCNPKKQFLWLSEFLWISELISLKIIHFTLDKKVSIKRRGRPLPEIIISQSGISNTKK